MSAIRQPIDEIFTPGQSVPASGIYALHHQPGCGDTERIVLLTAETFPSCRRCGGASFRLLHAAPHIREDADFSE